MKVYNLTTQKAEEYDASYAARLIEQGKAVLAQGKYAPKDKTAKREETEKAAKPDSLAKGKGASAGKAGGE